MRLTAFSAASNVCIQLIETQDVDMTDRAFVHCGMRCRSCRLNEDGSDFDTYKAHEVKGHIEAHVENGDFDPKADMAALEKQIAEHLSKPRVYRQ